METAADRMASASTPEAKQGRSLARWAAILALITGLGSAGVATMKYGSAVVRRLSPAASPMTMADRSKLAEELAPKVEHIVSERLTIAVVKEGSRFWLSAQRGAALEDRVAIITDDLAFNKAAHAVISAQIQVLQHQQDAQGATLMRIDDKVNSSSQALSGVAGKLDLLIRMRGPQR